MTTVDYAALLNAAEKATAGEWTYGSKFLAVKPDKFGNQYDRLAQCLDGELDGVKWNDNASFVVAAQPSTIIQVCADRKALLDRIEALTDALTTIRDSKTKIVRVADAREIARSTLSGERGE